MSRVSKSSVDAAFANAAATIRSSDTNGDGRYSRAEIAARVKTLSGTEKALVDMFSRFADHRDAQKYAKLTGKDLEKTLAYASEKLVAQYDVNHNGLSKSEIAKMSTTAKLAVEWAAELKGRAATTGAAAE